MPSCNSWPLEQWYDQFVPFFVFIAGSCSFVWLYHNLFSSSHRVGYLHYFLFLSIMNKQPWTFPDRCSYRHALSFLLSKQLGVKFLAHRMGVQPLPWPPLWLACFSSALSGLPSCPSGGSSGMKLQQAFCGGASGTSLQISEQGVGGKGRREHEARSWTRVVHRPGSILGSSINKQASNFLNQLIGCSSGFLPDGSISVLRVHSSCSFRICFPRQDRDKY